MIKQNQVSASRHTPEPWQLLEGEDACKADFGADNSGPYLTIVGGNGDPVCSSGDKVYEPHPVNKTNAARIVSCVNALAGMNPEAVPVLINLAKAAAQCLPVAAAVCASNGQECTAHGLKELAEEFSAALNALKGSK